MQVDGLCTWVLKLLIFQVFQVTGISKIDFFNFSGTERVKDFQYVTRDCKQSKREIQWYNKASTEWENCIVK